MFKWAASVFTSRSFSSRAIRPHDSKYWAAYRHGKDGRSQTVLIDMSHASTSDFPVLFPGLDIGNHSNDAKIDYIFDPGRFEIKTNTATVAGEEVFNNYGPKGNDELLLGYGFCIPQNPYNTVPLLLKAPPKELQRQIRDVHSGYFRTAQGDDEPQWNNERTTFQLSKPGDTTQPAHIFQHLPEALIELLIYVLHHEQIHSFTFVERPREYIVSEGGKRYLPHLANIMTQSLMAKLYKLQPDDLPEKPQNAKQQQAEIYRVDQRFALLPSWKRVKACMLTATRKLIESLLVCFRQYLRSLLAQDAVDLTRGPCLVRLETVVEFCKSFDGVRAPSSKVTARDGAWPTCLQAPPTEILLTSTCPAQVNSGTLCLLASWTALKSTPTLAISNSWYSLAGNRTSGSCFPLHSQLPAAEAMAVLSGHYPPTCTWTLSTCQSEPQR